MPTVGQLTRPMWLGPTSRCHSPTQDVQATPGHMAKNVIKPTHHDKDSPLHPTSVMTRPLPSADPPQ
eukprot:41169-Eustigmatos_ZCMA.PRE.1